MKNIILKSVALLCALSYPVGFMTMQPFTAVTVTTLIMASAFLSIFTFVNAN